MRQWIAVYDYLSRSQKMTLENRPPPAVAANAPTAESGAHSAVLLLDAVRLVAETIAADLGGAAEISDSGATLKFAMTSMQDNGQPPAVTCREIPLRAAQSICGYSIEMANATISPNLADEKRFTDEMLRESGVVSALCVPMFAGSQRLGAIGVFSRQPREFKLDDVWFVENIAELIAAVATRVKEERLLRERHKRGPAGGSAPSGDGQTSSSHTAAGGSSTDGKSPQGPQGRDHRASPRLPYACRQKVYPIVANQLPSPDCLYEVQCSDISCGGISFLLTEKPTFNDWVVALGRPPAVTYFTARTAHVRQIQWEGRTVYKVGCRLIDRVQL